MIFEKIKDNGIDTGETDNEVYLMLHELLVPPADMPLDFILPVRRILTFQYLRRFFRLVR